MFGRGTGEVEVGALPKMHTELDNQRGWTGGVLVAKRHQELRRQEKRPLFRGKRLTARRTLEKRRQYGALEQEDHFFRAGEEGVQSNYRNTGWGIQRAAPESGDQQGFGLVGMAKGPERKQRQKPEGGKKCPGPGCPRPRGWDGTGSPAAMTRTTCEGATSPNKKKQSVGKPES